MNTAIHATILTGLGIVITLIVTMHNLAKANQQETNRRIDELKKDVEALLDARFKVVDSQFKVVDSQFDVVNVKFQKLDGEIVEIRQEMQDIKRVIYRPAAS
jgi:hypothetical protein